MQEAFHGGLPARRPDLVLDRVAASHFDHRGALRGLSSHARDLFVRGGSFHEALQLFVEFLFDALLLEEGLQADRQVGYPMHGVPPEWELCITLQECGRWQVFAAAIARSPR